MKAARALLCLPVFLSMATGAYAQELIRLELVPTRGSSAVGYYRPQQADLAADRPATLKRLPPSLSNPSYAVLPIGPPGGGQVYHVVLDEPSGKPALLYVDSNGNGDLTDDPAAEWKGSASYSGGAMLRLAAEGSEMEVHLALYRFDPSAPSRKAYARKLFYYRDWVRRGTMDVGGTLYAAILSDESASGDFRSAATLLIDLNGDGEFHSSRESLQAREPFNIGGTTWEIRDMSWSGESFRLARSSRSAAEMVPPPDHRVGRRITPFVATDMRGRSVRFPEDYRGKVVLLDFWATWCGPCMTEVPNVVEVYKAQNPRGLEILGVSLDDSGQDAAVRAVLDKQGMSWPQIYEGGGWQARLAKLYAIDGIPAGFLVDGNTGLILAVSGSLRGGGLARAVQTALARK